MDGITDSMDMSVSKFQEIVKDREASKNRLHQMTFSSKPGPTEDLR